MITITKILFVGIWLMNCLFLLVMTDTILERRYTKGKTIIISAVIVGIAVLFRAWCHSMRDQAVVPFSSEIVTLMMILLQIICFKGRVLKRVVSLLIIEIMCIVVEFIAVFITNMAIGSFELYNYASASFRFMILMYYVVFALVTYPTIKLLGLIRDTNDNVTTSYYGWLVLCFPLGQLLIFQFHSGVTTVATVPGIMGILLGSVAEVALVFTLRNESKRKELVRELELQKEELLREEEYYKVIESREEEMARIRHDYQNQLLVLKRLQ